MPARNPTIRGISRLLAAEGHEKSTFYRSGRGMRRQTPGFVVQQGARDGVVLVTHQTFSYTPLASEREHIADMLKRYAEVIAVRGYEVRQDDQAPYGGLIVTAGTDRADYDDPAPGED